MIVIGPRTHDGCIPKATSIRRAAGDVFVMPSAFRTNEKGRPKAASLDALRADR
jgi:hypothetical protein